MLICAKIVIVTRVTSLPDIIGGTKMNLMEEIEKEVKKDLERIKIDWKYVETIHISEIGFKSGERIVNILLQNGITNLKELYEYSIKEKDFTKIRNIGDSFAQEIEKKLDDISCIVKNVKIKREKFSKGIW